MEEESIFQKYFFLVLLVLFVTGIIYFLINQPFFVPFDESGEISTTTVSIFLGLVSIDVFLLFRLIQEFFRDTILKTNQFRMLNQFKHRFLRIITALDFSFLITAILGAQIFGILDAFVLIFIIVIFLLIFFIL